MYLLPPSVAGSERVSNHTKAEFGLQGECECRQRTKQTSKECTVGDGINPLGDTLSAQTMLVGLLVFFLRGDVSG